MKNYRWPELDLDDPQTQQAWLWPAVETYSNPWWTDPRDFTQDELARTAAQKWFEGQCLRNVRRRVRRRQALFLCAVMCTAVVLSYLAFDSWIGESDGDGLDKTLLLIVALPGSGVFLPLLWGLYVGFRRNWAETYPYMEFRNLKRQLKERSIDDYRTWLSELRTTEPDLFFQIMTWSQNENALQIQRKTLRAAQRAAFAAESAANAAWANERSTQAIRNQIKYGHE